MKSKMNNNTITIHPHYLWIDYENKRTRNAYNINRCQFVLIDKEERSLYKHINDEEFVKRTKKWLKEQSPKNEWFFQKSRSDNYGFWKKQPKSPTGEDWGNQELIKKAKEHAKKMKKQQQLAIDFSTKEKMAA